MEQHEHCPASASIVHSTGHLGGPRRRAKQLRGCLLQSRVVEEFIESALLLEFEAHNHTMARVHDGAEVVVEDGWHLFGAVQFARENKASGGLAPQRVGIGQGSTGLVAERRRGQH